MARYDLSETEWRLIEPLLPNKPRGVARVDDLRVINGIFTASSMCCGPVHPGATCRAAMVPPRRSTLASTVGPRRASGSGCSRPCRRLRRVRCT